MFDIYIYRCNTSEKLNKKLTRHFCIAMIWVLSLPSLTVVSSTFPNCFHFTQTFVLFFNDKSALHFYYSCILVSSFPRSPLFNNFYFFVYFLELSPSCFLSCFPWSSFFNPCKMHVYLLDFRDKKGALKFPSMRALVTFWNYFPSY